MQIGKQRQSLRHAGQIRRGTGEEITAVLWASDLRGFTERSDRLAGTSGQPPRASADPRGLSGRAQPDKNR
jgi:hypothetical protein